MRIQDGAMARTCWLVVGLAGLLVSGCGGGESGVGQAGTAALDTSDLQFMSGCYVDLMPFTTTRSGLVVIEMNRAPSGSLDNPAIRVVSGWCASASEYNSSLDSAGYVIFDDDSGGCLNARVVFSAGPGAEYTVAFTSAAPGDTGNYAWRIVETDNLNTARRPQQADAPGPDALNDRFAE